MAWSEAVLFMQDPYYSISDLTFPFRMTENIALVQIWRVETDPVKCMPFWSKQRAILSSMEKILNYIRRFIIILG